jgi:hypothetical protein
MVRQVHGVTGVTNLVTVASQVRPEQVQVITIARRCSGVRPRSTPVTSGWGRPTTRPSSTGRCSPELGKCRERRAPGQASLASVKSHLLISPRPWPTTAKNWKRPARRGPAFVIHFGKLYKLWAGTEKIVIAESNSSTVSSGPARM